MRKQTKRLRTAKAEHVAELRRRVVRRPACDFTPAGLPNPSGYDRRATSRLGRRPVNRRPRCSGSAPCCNQQASRRIRATSVLASTAAQRHWPTASPPAVRGHRPVRWSLAPCGRHPPWTLIAAQFRHDANRCPQAWPPMHQVVGGQTRCPPASFTWCRYAEAATHRIVARAQCEIRHYIDYWASPSRESAPCRSCGEHLCKPPLRYFPIGTSSNSPPTPE